MFTVIFFTGFCFGGAAVIDECAQQLAADVKRAMKRADLSIDYVARIIQYPVPKLCDQLNGRAPFTAFWRFSHREIRELTEFWPEFLEVQAHRIDRAFLRVDVVRLIDKVDELVADRRTQLKAVLPGTEKAKAV